MDSHSALVFTDLSISDKVCTIAAKSSSVNIGKENIEAGARLTFFSRALKNMSNGRATIVLRLWIKRNEAASFKCRAIFGVLKIRESGARGR